MYKNKQPLPEVYQDLPIVDTWKGMKNHMPDTVRLRGKYRRFDWDIPNAEAFDQQALIYLKDGMVLMIGRPQTEEGIRPSQELKKLHNKQVEVVGKILPKVNPDPRASSLNMGLIKDVQFISRR